MSGMNSPSSDEGPQAESNADQSVLHEDQGPSLPTNEEPQAETEEPSLQAHAFATTHPADTDEPATMNGQESQTDQPDQASSQHSEDDKAMDQSQMNSESALPPSEPTQAGNTESAPEVSSKTPPEPPVTDQHSSAPSHHSSSKE